MKPFGYVILIALFSLGPLLFLFNFIPNIDEDVTSKKLEDLGVVILETPKTIDFSGFVDHLRRPLEENGLKGKWTFAYFGFTRCPDFCPTTLSVIAKAERLLSENVDNFDRKLFLRYYTPIYRLLYRRNPLVLGIFQVFPIPYQYVEILVQEIKIGLS